jgi:integrase
VVLSALLFLYKNVLFINLPYIDNIERARRPALLPVVFTQDEVSLILTRMGGVHHLMASLLYDSGLRLTECLSLRVKDIDFGYRQINVRDGKGFKDRQTMLPLSLIEALQAQLQYAKRIHQQDLSEGLGEVFLPNALEKKYPKLNREWGWQLLFPAVSLSVDPRSGRMRRHHILERPLQNGYDIRTVQELLGHKDVKTTMMAYTHVLNRVGRGVRSPLDK